MPNYLPPGTRGGAKVMIFVDGENLAIRFGALLGEQPPPEHVAYEKHVAAWAHYLNPPPSVVEVIRKYYYTTVGQDEPRRREIEAFLKQAGIEAPRVFPKPKGKRSKRVDISLATDMLTHAHRDNYDIAILVAGDEDYVPLVEAVMAEGKRVAVWFFESGLSPALRLTADHFFDIGTVLLERERRNLSYIHL